MSEYHGEVKDWHGDGTPLEALDSLMDGYAEMCYDTGNNDIQYQLYNLTSQHHTIRKALLALEIISKRDVFVALIKSSENYEDYNKHIFPEGYLSENEFKTIKEVLK